MRQHRLIAASKTTTFLPTSSSTTAANLRTALPVGWSAPTDQHCSGCNRQISVEFFKKKQLFRQIARRFPATLEMLKGATSSFQSPFGTILGFAAFSGIYPGPALKPGIFLKELFVSAAQRGRGFGRELMRALAALARERGLVRIDWTADPENAKLLDFYDGLGGQRKPDKLFYRLDGKARGAGDLTPRQRRAIRNSRGHGLAPSASLQSLSIGRTAGCLYGNDWINVPPDDSRSRRTRCSGHCVVRR